jgi:hypothetical protein
MKRTLFLTSLIVSLGLPLTLAAQAAAPASAGGGQSAPNGESPYTMNHAEIGVYADYFRFSPSGEPTSNFVGTGGRIGFNVHPNIALEGEMAYDFARNYTTSYSVTNGTTTTTTFQTSSLRPLSGLFGPKFQFGTSSSWRIFAEGKIGFIDFSNSNPNNVTGAQFNNAVSGVGGSGTHLAFFPGGGVEGFIGPVGLRVEAGDEVYLNNGAYNNLRISAGPTFRF